MREELIREILDKALTEELGLVITCDNPKATELQINKFKTNQPKYAGLMLCWKYNVGGGHVTDDKIAYKHPTIS